MKAVCLILLLTFLSHQCLALPACGNGVIDSGETCDRLLTTCCNSTCNGMYDYTTILFPTQTCYESPENYARLAPFIADPTLTYEWLFVQVPAGASPIAYTPSLQSTYFHFDSNGFYRLTVRISTPFCGQYYTGEVSFVVNDCCGNGVLDNSEQCDYGIEDNGCCDKDWCSFTPQGYECIGDINDQCTHTLSCDGQGGCVSTENVPFTVVALQTQSVVDNACLMDVRQFNFETAFADVDNTPGKYSWNAIIYESYPLHLHTIVNAHGLIDGPSGIVAFGVKMLGGGSVYVRLDVEDACGLTESIYYNVSRSCCGNLILNTGETCDDGNTVSGDYCSSDCTAVTGYCGDSILQTNEVCDYKNSACCGPSCQSILPSSTVCRPSKGDCDVQETCTGTNAECPVDVFKPANTTCRSALGACDAVETCTGYTPTCPNQNAPLPSSVMCREPSGECTLPTYCDGVSFGCAGVQYRNTTCRRAENTCDVDERCTVGNANCPVDGFAPAGTACIIDGTECTANITSCAGDSSTCSLLELPSSCPVSGVTSPSPSSLSTCLSTICMVSGECTYDALGGTCFINGECFERNETSPYNPCNYCNPDVDQYSWTSYVDGSPCLTANDVSACSATWDMCVAGVCIDQYLAVDTPCRSPAGLCDVPEFCTGLSDYCPRDEFANATVICHLATDVCDVTDTCSGSGPACPTDNVQPNTVMCRARAGPCDVPEMCDGVHKSCPVDVFKDTHEVCRVSAGECDRQEMCTGVSALCPDDGHYGHEMICREAKSSCDVEERCTGTGIHCPPDVFADISFICRQAADACDRPEYCTGHSIYCPIDTLLPPGTPCRESQGSCDIPEYCSGSSKACPVDRVRSSGTVCRRAVGPCDKEEKCDGRNASCPDDAVRGPTFICRSSTGPCDLPEYCSFGNSSCPVDSFYNSSTVCRAAKGLCDVVEYCPGDGSRCPPDEKVPAGVTCRASVDICDKPEVCSGVHDRCPQNRFEPTSTICRLAENDCDLPEHCTGYTTSCPADIRAPTTKICRSPSGPCERPSYCTEEGDCGDVDYYDSSTVCHLQDSQCDATLFCSGNASTCSYSTPIIGSSCDTTGLQCTQDFCTDENLCETLSSNCACTIDAQCPTTQSCLIGRCVNYQCQKSTVAGTCFIDGNCYESGEQNPLNACQICRPSLSTYLWMPMPLGTHCSTGEIEGECSAQDTCNANGVCVDRYRTGSVCRASAGDCDLQEVCVAGNDHCPEDVFKSSSTICREQNGACDAPEYCGGETAYCPTDDFFPSCYMCRESRGACDDPEYCTGETRQCPKDVMTPRGTLCRDIDGDCDAPEYCDGDSTQCPTDALRSTGWVCRPGLGLCDNPETCSGHSKICPPDVLFSAGTVCRYADDLCDEQEICDGVSTQCPEDRFSSVTKVCRPVVGPCDRAEYCTNTSKYCPSDHVAPSGFTCRQALDVCDKTELCDGVSKMCPRDEYALSTQICRGAGSRCDVDDYCTGDSVRCPIDNRRPDGYPCSDGDFCNGDEFCLAGVCTPSTAYRNCSRPDGCSLDFCDELSERCMHTAITGVGQICYSGPSGTMGVGACKAGTYSCNGYGDLECRGEVVPKPFEFCGNAKDDDCNGIVDDGCHTGPCATDLECVNSPIDTCHLGHCNNESKCVYHLLPNFCFINGNCYTFNEYKTHNPCQRCFPNVSITEWSPTNQANVSDNNICNGGEQCRDGRVYVFPPALNCRHLSSPCVNGVCDPARGCYQEYIPDGSSCRIAGSTCSVEFTCSGGQCVCNGILHSESTHVSLIVGLGIGLPLIGTVLILIAFFVYIHERSVQASTKLK